MASPERGVSPESSIANNLKDVQAVKKLVTASFDALKPVPHEVDTINPQFHLSVLRRQFDLDTLAQLHVQGKGRFGVARWGQHVEEKTYGKENAGDKETSEVWTYFFDSLSVKKTTDQGIMHINYDKGSDGMSSQVVLTGIENPNTEEEKIWEMALTVHDNPKAEEKYRLLCMIQNTKDVVTRTARFSPRGNFLEVTESDKVW